MAKDDTPNKKMIIEHRTFDQAHQQTTAHYKPNLAISRPPSATKSDVHQNTYALYNPSPRPTSTAKSVKDFFSSQTSGSSGLSPADEGPAILWPNVVEPPHGGVPRKEKNETQAKQRQTPHRREESLVWSAQPGGKMYWVPRREDSRSVPARGMPGSKMYSLPRKEDTLNKQEPDAQPLLRRYSTVQEPPSRKPELRRILSDAKTPERPSRDLSLRRKPGIADRLREKFLAAPQESEHNPEKRRAAKQRKMEKIQQARIYIRDGKMEKVIPAISEV